MEFKKVKLGVYIETISDTTPINKEKVILINTSDVENGYVLNHSYVDNKNLKGQFKKRFKNGDILYSEIRPKNRRFAYIDFDANDYIASTKLMVIRNKGNINNDFLFQVLKSENIINHLQMLAETRSGTFPQITFKEISNLEISIPTLENQNRISNFLKNIDKKIELNNHINDSLQKLINNLFTRYFVNFDTYNGNYKKSDLGMIPETFEVRTLGNVISFSNGYGWNSKDMLDTHITNSYKVFKMGNINIGGGINKSKTKSWILKDKVINLEQYISKKGDILMCMTDMKNSGNPLLGHTALIDKNGEFVINQRVGILRCDKKIGYSYIYTMSNMPYFINEIRSRANSGVQVNLTTKGICDTLVLIPDNNTLSEFENVAIPLYEQIFNNNNENESLEKLRDTILPKLMNGEIDLDKIEI